MSCALFEVCFLDYDITLCRFPGKEILVFVEITLSNSHEGLYLSSWNFYCIVHLFKIMFIHSLALGIFSVCEFSNPGVSNADGNIGADNYEKKKRYVNKLCETADNFRVVSCN